MIDNKEERDDILGKWGAKPEKVASVAPQNIRDPVSQGMQKVKGLRDRKKARPVHPHRSHF